MSLPLISSQAVANDDCSAYVLSTSKNIDAY